jgi:C1A family cysteine protease
MVNNRTITVILAVTAIIASLAVYNKVSQTVEISPEVVVKFNLWLSQQKKLYGTPSEMNLRLSNFKANLDKIEMVNSRKSGYTAGLNQFSDLSAEEFAAKYLMKNSPFKNKISDNAPVMKKNSDDTLIQQGSIPDSLDLRTVVGATVPIIKNQKSCGSCYAFASTTTLEYALLFSKNAKHKYEAPLSNQELVDCSGVSI